MANVDRPNGFKPVRHLNGMPWNGQTNKYYVASGVVYIGDPVIAETGTADDDGIPAVIVAAAGSEDIIGICIGIDMATQSEDVNANYITAGGYISVVDDPSVIFEVQEDANMGVAGIGKNCDMITYATGNTTSGTSIMELDSSEVTANAATFRVLRAVQRVDNDPTLTNAKFEVYIVEHAYNHTTSLAT